MSSFYDGDEGGGDDDDGGDGGDDEELGRKISVFSAKVLMVGRL